MDIIVKVKSTDVFSIYKTTANYINDSYWDFEKLENKLSRLKKGGALTYDDLEFISSKEIWPAFSKWYRWPSKVDIENELKNTDGLFAKKQTDENIKLIFENLHGIFKHIELVSIILRSVDPDNYGMYSPPVAFHLNTPRGSDYWNEYIEYLKKLREYKEHFRMDKIAYVDMFIWAISMSQTQQINLNQKSFTIDYADIVIKNSKFHDSIESSLKAIEGKNDIEIAEFFHEFNLSILAARNASIALEAIVKSKCRHLLINNIDNFCSLMDIYWDKVSKKVPLDELHKARKLRNAIIHDEYIPTNDEISFIIDICKKISNV